MNRRRRLAGAAATTAWLATPALVRAQSQALKIAVLLPRSGYLAQAGQSCHRGAQIAGKVLSDFGYRVELTHIDIESSPEISRTQAEKVINEGAHCIVGAFDSGCTLVTGTGYTLSGTFPGDPAHPGCKFLCQDDLKAKCVVGP